MNHSSIQKGNQQGHIVIFKTEDGKISVDARFSQETVWLNLDQMSELFERDKSTISRHIKNVFEEGELERESVVADFATTAADGKNYLVAYYNLDVIISVGYRVKSLRGTQFRIWATKRLHEYMIKGFTMDDERLKHGGGRYFRELLQRVRDIRSSERNLYQQVTDIYATAIDYDPKAEITRQFFACVQNKILPFRRIFQGDKKSLTVTVMDVLLYWLALDTIEHPLPRYLIVRHTHAGNGITTWCILSEIVKSTPFTVCLSKRPGRRRAWS